jgi:Probable molybdopterin binding domain
MTIAGTPAPKEAITAALLVIGDRILSGRTKDQNIGYVAEYLTALGMHLAEVRVIGDEETAIVDGSMRSGSATAMSSPLAALGRPMTTSPLTAWPRRLECRSTSIRARLPSCTSG